MGVLLNDPVFVFLTLLTLSAIGYNIWEVYKRSRAWKRITAETGMVFAETRERRNNFQTLSGVYRHHQLVLKEGDFIVYRNGKKKANIITNASTSIQVEIKNPKAANLTLIRIPLKKNSDPIIGDEEVDNRYRLTNEPDGFARAVISSQTARDNLLKVKVGGAIMVKENEIIYDQSGRLLEADQIFSLFDLLCSMADAVDAYNAS
jgi:hypothetical protein